MRRELWAEVALQRLDRVIGVRAGKVEEHRRDPVQPLLGPLHRLDGIGKARRLRIGRDRIDVRARLRHRRLEGGRELPGVDRGERGQSERRVPIVEQRGFCRGHGDPPDRVARTIGRIAALVKSRKRAQPLRQGVHTPELTVVFTPRANALTSPA